jgi:hypothetical protein
MQDSHSEARVENLPDLELDTASPCGPAPQSQERRKLRRAKLRLLTRVRPGEFDDGAFEEVAATLNASRKAFYFDTASDRYRVGMRLRVNFPHDPKASAMEVDGIGEVVRVDKKPKAYGVAVVFWKQGETPVAAARPHGTAEASHGAAERRRHPREAVVAAIELIDLPTGLKARANTSDVSLGGCYVNTLNPFRLGTTLGLKIEHGGRMLEAEATVCTRFEGSGMGLAFLNVTAEQLCILTQWLPVDKSVFAGYAT